MEMIKPEGCLKFDVCKFAGDSACLEGCDFRLEVALHSTSTNKSSPKLPGLLILKKEVNRWYLDRIAKGEMLEWSGFRRLYEFIVAGKIGR